MAATLTEAPTVVEARAPTMPMDTLQIMRAAALALGMDPDTKNKLQVPDAGFIQEMMMFPIDFAGMPQGTDVEGMRRWVGEVFENEAFLESRRNIDIKRRRPVQNIRKTIMPAPCLGDDHQSFDLWIYEPINETKDAGTQLRPAVLMFHGGGWIHGNPVGDEFIAEIFASDLDAVVVGVDYRLAPEHKFPEPLDDCVEAVNWVVANAIKYNVDVHRIGLWGASAGGNLAAALAIRHVERQRQESLPDLCYVSLVVPVTAHPQAFETFEKERDFPKSESELLFTNAPPAPPPVVEEFEKLLEMYVGTGDASDGLVSPLMASPSTQHPPTNITVAACDYLRPQGQAYAEALRRAGVNVTEDILPGVPHGFTFAPNAEVTKRWLERQVESFATAFRLV